MLRNFRIGKPAQQKPWGRRLAFQRLEERLTLSAASPTAPITSTLDLSLEGGFVNVGALDQSFFLSTSGVVSFGEFFPSDTIADKPLSLDLNGVLNNDMSIIPPLDPFSSDPGGGVVGPLIETRPFGPLPPPLETAEEFLPATGSEEFVAEESSLAGETPQRLTSGVVLSRGREIFFKVATLAPPQTLAKPDRIANGTRVAHAALARPTSTGNTSAPVTRGEQASAPLATESSAEVTAAEQPSTEKRRPESVFQKTSSPKTGRAIHSTTNYDQIDAEQTISTSRPKAAISATALQSVAVVVPEEEARSQVFSDWRNRDLIALPLLVALAAGPRLTRGLRSSTIEAQQLPPNRNR